MSKALNRGPRIIAFTGPKTCGKDTMASILFQQNKQLSGKYTPFFMRTPFAGGVKQICHDVFGWSLEDQERFDFKETPLDVWPNCEPRWPMMDIANWFRDKYGPDVWVRTLQQRIETLERNDPHGAYVVTDLRFPNEMDWLDKQNSLVIYIDRPQAEESLAKGKAAGDAKALNPSEAHYEELRERADLVLANDAEIYKAQGQLMNHIRNRFDHWVYWQVGPFTKEVADA
jgi:hypothetical protein